MYESEKYDSHVRDERAVCRWADVWNERTVYGVRTRDCMCNVSDVNTILGWRGVYGVPERPVLDRNGVYGVREYMLGRNIRNIGMYGNDEPSVWYMYGWVLLHRWFFCADTMYGWKLLSKRFF